MGSSVAIPLSLIGLLMATVGVEASVATSDDDQPIINHISPPPQSYNGGQVQVQGAQECSANGGECIAVVYRVFRGGAEQAAPVCCKMMMEITQNCLLLLFPNPNIFPIFRTYCTARYGGGSDAAPGAGAAGPPAPAPVGL